jgi:hypothetical protein
MRLMIDVVPITKVTQYETDCYFKSPSLVKSVILTDFLLIHILCFYSFDHFMHVSYIFVYVLSPISGIVLSRQPAGSSQFY